MVWRCGNARSGTASCFDLVEAHDLVVCIEGVDARPSPVVGRVGRWWAALVVCQRGERGFTDLHHRCPGPSPPTLASGRGVPVLNLHRLSPGAESYYLDQVVSGLEDYYAEARRGVRATGSRRRSSSASRGSSDPTISGPCSPGSIRPTGERLHRAKNRKVPGWDLTFRAPKSVSILWALGEPEDRSRGRRSARGCGRPGGVVHGGGCGVDEDGPQRDPPGAGERVHRGGVPASHVA